MSDLVQSKTCLILFRAKHDDDGDDLDDDDLDDDDDDDDDDDKTRIEFSCRPVSTHRVKVE